MLTEIGSHFASRPTSRLPLRTSYATFAQVSLSPNTHPARYPTPSRPRRTPADRTTPAKRDRAGAAARKPPPPRQLTPEEKAAEAERTLRAAELARCAPRDGDLEVCSFKASFAVSETQWADGPAALVAHLGHQPALATLLRSRQLPILEHVSKADRLAQGRAILERVKNVEQQARSHARIARFCSRCLSLCYAQAARVYVSLLK